MRLPLTIRTTFFRKTLISTVDLQEIRPKFETAKVTNKGITILETYRDYMSAREGHDKWVNKFK